MSKNIYTGANNSQYSKGNMCKTQRGFGPVYDSILETYLQLNGVLPKSVLEIGIGNVGSHIDWACALPESQIYGFDNCVFSIDPAGTDAGLGIQNDTVMGQWANNIRGIAKLHFLPMEMQSRLTLHWQRDGYELSTAVEFCEQYGIPDIISNDGKQDGLAHNPLLDTWKDRVNPKGVIVQDKIGRAGGQKSVYGKQIDKAIAKGWAVYDCRHLTQMDTDAVENGFIAVYGPPEYSDNLDKVASRVHDIYELLPSKYLADVE